MQGQGSIVVVAILLGFSVALLTSLYVAIMDSFTYTVANLDERFERMLETMNENLEVNIVNASIVGTNVVFEIEVKNLGSVPTLVKYVSMLCIENNTVVSVSIERISIATNPGTSKRMEVTCRGCAACDEVLLIVITERGRTFTTLWR